MKKPRVFTLGFLMLKEVKRADLKNIKRSGRSRKIDVF